MPESRVDFGLDRKKIFPNFWVFSSLNDLQLGKTYSKRGEGIVYYPHLLLLALTQIVLTDYFVHYNYQSSNTIFTLYLWQIGDNEKEIDWKTRQNGIQNGAK